jgi:hypothetical protein
MWIVFDIVVFAGGFTSCWYLKDGIIQSIRGSEALVKSLEAKLAALKASV